MKRFFLSASLSLCCVSLLHATADTLYPEVGKPCPEFILKNVNYYTKKQVTLADFKGKWLVLDFWNKHCSACVESFPKVNAMQKQFSDHVQFLLIGIQDAESQIKPMYERFQKRLNLALPCAFDSTLSDYWGIFSTPHILVIDENGTVQARTIKLESADIEAFLKGERPALSVIPYVAERKEPGAPNIGEQKIPFDFKKPYLINGNGSTSDTDFLFRSVLTKWDQKTQKNSYPISIDIHSIDRNYPKGMFQTLGITLDGLYRYAYFGTQYWGIGDTSAYGKYFPNPVLQVKDSSLFRWEADGKNAFCYSLKLPPEKGTKENLQKVMQKDLDIYFGYDVSVETRKCPCWRLVASEAAITKLATKGGKENVEAVIPWVSYRLSNVPMKKLIAFLLRYTKEEVIIDDTRISQNIDITTDCTDLESAKAFLSKYGLGLAPAEKEMKVLVIRDVKN